MGLNEMICRRLNRDKNCGRTINGSFSFKLTPLALLIHLYQFVQHIFISSYKILISMKAGICVSILDFSAENNC